MDWLKPAIYVCLVFWLLGIWIKLSQPLANQNIGTLLLIPELLLIVLLAILVARWIKRLWTKFHAQHVTVKRPNEPKDFQVDRWNALVRYDPEIAAAAEQLRPFGEKWIQVLGRDYFSLQEDRTYLPHIVRRLMEDAQREAEQNNNNVGIIPQKVTR